MEWAGGFGDLGTLLEVFPPAVLGVIVFVAGAQLAMDVRSRGEDRREFLAMVVTAALAIWNVGIAFVAGSAVLFVARHIRSKP